METSGKMIRGKSSNVKTNSETMLGNVMENYDNVVTKMTQKLWIRS